MVDFWLKNTDGRSASVYAAGTGKPAFAHNIILLWGIAGSRVPLNVHAGERLPDEILVELGRTQDERQCRTELIDGVLIPMPSNWQPSATELRNFYRDVMGRQAKQTTEGVVMIKEAIEAIRTHKEPPSLTALAETMGLTRPKLTRGLTAAGIESVSVWIDRKSVV